MTPILEGWEACDLIDAEQVAVGDYMLPFVVDGAWVTIGRDRITKANLSVYGIKPVRRVKPLEFTVYGGQNQGTFEAYGTEYRCPQAWIGITFQQVMQDLKKAEELNKPAETPVKPETPVNVPVKTLVRGASALLNGSKPDSEMPSGWAPSAVVVKSGPKGVALTPDENISLSSRLASQLQTTWEGFLDEAPLVPRPKAGKWLAKYSPETYVEGLVELALTSKTEKFTDSALHHIRDSDAELIGYILLLEKRIGTAQRERFCTDLLIQQLARVK